MAALPYLGMREPESSLVPYPIENTGNAIITK